MSLVPTWPTCQMNFINWINWIFPATEETVLYFWFLTKLKGSRGNSHCGTSIINGRLEMFQILSEISESPCNIITISLFQNLTQLSTKFDKYFPEDPKDGNLWVLDPLSYSQRLWWEKSWLSYQLTAAWSLHTRSLTLLHSGSQKPMNIQLFSDEQSRFCCLSLKFTCESQAIQLETLPNQRIKTSRYQCWLPLSKSAFLQFHPAWTDYLKETCPNVSMSVIPLLSCTFFLSPTRSLQVLVLFKLW